MLLCVPAAVTALCSAGTGANIDCNYVMVLLCRLRQMWFLLVAKYPFLSLGVSLVKLAVFNLLTTTQGFFLDHVVFFWNEGAFVCLRFCRFFHLLSMSFPIFFQAGMETCSFISHWTSSSYKNHYFWIVVTVWWVVLARTCPQNQYPVVKFTGVLQMDFCLSPLLRHPNSTKYRQTLAFLVLPTFT